MDAKFLLSRSTTTPAHPTTIESQTSHLIDGKENNMGQLKLLLDRFHGNLLAILPNHESTKLLLFASLPETD